MALRQSLDNPDGRGLRPTGLSRYAYAVPRALRAVQGFGDRGRASERDPDEFVDEWIPYEEHVRELAVLKLSGRPYTPGHYREAVERYAGLPIGIRTVDELVQAPAAATITYDAGGAGATIWVPRRLDWWLRQYAIFHELAHVAAGHPPRERTPRGLRADWAEEPPFRRLARRSAPKPEDLRNGPVELFRRDPEKFYEKEADLRAQHNMVTSSLGARALEFDRLSQLR